MPLNKYCSRKVIFWDLLILTRLLRDIHLYAVFNHNSLNEEEED